MTKTARAAAGAAVLLLALVAGPSGAAAAPLAVTLTPAVTRAPVGAYDTTRAAVVVSAPGIFTAAVEAIPAGGRLLTAIAVPETIGGGPLPTGASPVRFRVLLDVDGATVVLFERVVDPGDPRDRRWFDVGRDLASFAGRRATLRFEATPTRADAAVVPPAWWSPPEIVACNDDAPSVLLVTIDALRADHLGSYGYARPTTPRLDAFAADATRFAAAFAGGPKTIPSVPQILTGSYFYWHRPQRGLDDLLGADGTPSRAIVDNPYVAAWLRAERPGFDAVQAGDLDARAITSAALRYATAAGRCRTTLYLHYLDTHTPYRPPRRWARRFVDRTATTTVGLAFDDVSGAWQGRYEDADRQRIIDLYDGSLAYVDRQLGRLFRGLRHRGRLDRTLVIVTADHGEELWDHRQFFHGQSLYDELLHVPLIVRWPAAARGRVVDDLVGTVDVVPTIAAAAGRAAPNGDGRDLAAGAGGVADPARSVFALVALPEPRTPERQAVRTATMKMIRNVADGLIEVYDLVRDPREKRNLGAAAAGGADLQRALDAMRARLDGTGYQLRVRSRGTAPVGYVVNVTTDPPAPLIAIDRLSLERGERIDFLPRASAFSVTGTVEPGEDDHVRFDVLAAAGTLKIAVVLDGAPAPAGTLRLGPARAPAGAVVDLADPQLIGTPRDDAGADAPPFFAELWRASTDTVAAPALDDATRERLRQLGYVE